MKFNMGTLDLDNHHLAADLLLDLTCPCLAELNSRLARISASTSEFQVNV